MILEKVTGRNFLSFKEFEIELANKGLVSIEGVDMDASGALSNGAGKSSLMNAILWCNYGHSGKNKLGVDDVINMDAGKDCWVQSVWLDEITNERYMVTRYRKHSAYKNELHLGTRFTNLTKGTNDATQEEINKILGSDLKTFQAHCFARQKDAVDIPAMTDGELKTLLETVLPFESLDLKTKRSRENLSSQKELVEAAKRQLERLKEKTATVKEEGKAAVQLFRNYATEISLKNAAIDTQIELVRTAMSVAMVSILPDYDRVLNAAKELEAKHDAVGDGDVGGWTAKFKFAARELDKIDADIVNIDKLLNCSACGQAVDDRATVLATLNANRAKAVTVYESTKESLQRATDCLQQQVKLKLQSEELRDSISNHNKAKDTLIHLEGKISLLEGQKAVAGTNPHKATVTRLKAVLEDLQTELDATEIKIADEEAKIPILEAVAQIYSPKGLRYYILETVTPYLNERTNYYLKQLTEGSIGAVWSTVTKLKSGDYKEKFSIEIRKKKLTNYESLSGGEQRKVQLSCFLALQDLIASRATKEIKLFCVDEIDHALDAAGVERLMHVLDEKTKVKPTILVISHNDLKSWIPNTAKVTKKDDISHVTGFLSGT